jgi:hypothetical protein
MKKIRLRFMMMRKFRILTKIRRNHRVSQMISLLRLRDKGKIAL